MGVLALPSGTKRGLAAGMASLVLALLLFFFAEPKAGLLGSRSLAMTFGILPV
jgi:hypothetical protein